MRPFGAALSVALVLAGSSAWACGAAYPGGPIMCDYPRKAGPSAAPILRLSTSYAYTSTTLLFGSGRRADLERHTMFGALEVPLARTTTLQFGAGGIAGGSIGGGDIGPGAAGFFGVGFRVLQEKDALPFVQITTTLSAAHALTRAPTRERYTAFDLRVGAIAGKTFANALTPYVVARVFGGPIAWRIAGEDVTGTDLYKYQVGGGISLALLERRLDVFVEGIALGERGVSAGIGTTFF